MPSPKKVSPFADQSAPAAAPAETMEALPSELQAVALTRKPLSEAAQAAQAERMAEAAQAEVAAGDDAQHIERPRARIPFGTHRQRLKADERPGFKRRWFNDIADRIQAAQDAGYTHVLNPQTRKPVQATAGSRSESDGGRGAVVAYLMEIPVQFWNEDFEAKQERLNEVDRQIYSGRHNEEPGDKRYIPRSGMNVRVDRGIGR